jgi:hypothetical protein
MNVAYATLVSEGYWTLEMDLILGALIIESYLLGLTQDTDHFDREIELFIIGTEDFGCRSIQIRVSTKLIFPTMSYLNELILKGRIKRFSCYWPSIFSSYIFMFANVLADLV